MLSLVPLRAAPGASRVTLAERHPIDQPVRSIPLPRREGAWLVIPIVEQRGHLRLVEEIRVPANPTPHAYEEADSLAAYLAPRA